MATVRRWGDLPLNFKIQSLVIPGLIVLFLVAPALAWFWWWKWGGVLWVAQYWNPTVRSGDDKGALLSQLGVTGDLFGGINALFAAYAFAGVGIAALLQSRTYMVALRQQHILERQFQDAHEDRAVERQRHRDEVYREKQQSTESLLFQLLTLHRENRLSDLQLEGGTTNSAHAATAAPFLADRITKTDWFQTLELTHKDQAVPDQIVTQMHSFYEYTFYKPNESTLGPHFRTLQVLLKLIDDSNLRDRERDRYADIVKATIAGPELFLLMLHCASARGQHIRLLANDYGVFENMERVSGVSPATTVAVVFLDLFFDPTATAHAEERQAAREKSRAARRAALMDSLYVGKQTPQRQNAESGSS